MSFHVVSRAEKAANDQKETKEEKFTFNLLLVICVLSIFVNWEMVFCATSLEGNKFDKGIIFGFSESVAQIISGILAQNLHDKPLFLSMIVLCLLSNASYFWYE
jgi:uncharacterized membrane protein (DUF485 family)